MNIGIVGLGHLGKIHLKLLKEIPEYNVNGIYDIDKTITKEIGEAHSVKVCDTYDALLSSNEVICIVTPTPSHYELAAKAIKAGKHVFIEKPSTIDAADTKKLIKLAHEAGVYAQVGHVERFNPAFIAIKDHIKDPLFFEIHRLASYNVRGTDVSVVLDLMIHDIDLVIYMVKSKVKKISASGNCIVSKTPDFVSARIEFENGCVANFTANRVAVANKRMISIYQENTYLSMDLLNKTAVIDNIEINKVNPSDNQLVNIESVVLDVKPLNSLKKELEDFYKSISTKTAVSVSLQDAENALMIAQEIELQLTT